MKLFLTIIGISILSIGYTQKDVQYSFYNFNPELYNSAYVGSREALTITLIGRKQWLNFGGSPTTATLSVHSPIMKSKINLGLSITQDAIGSRRNTGVFGDIAYRVPINRNWKLAGGLKGGFDMFYANFTNLEVVTADDEKYTTGIGGKLLPNVGFGLYLNSNSTFYGLSAPKLLENDITASGLGVIQKRHFFLTAGHSFEITPGYDFIGTTILKLVRSAPLSLDVNGSILFVEKISIGAGYRFGDSFNVNLVYYFNDKLKAGYVFDYTLSDLSSYNIGTHEIMLNYDLNFKGKGFTSPRIF